MVNTNKNNTMKSVTVIHCWSAPRSRSTALLYSFEARGESNCAALDEPLYREWLISKGSDRVARPYFQQVIDGTPPSDEHPSNAYKWQRELLSLDERIQQAVRQLNTDGVVFCKHMAKHSFLYHFDQELAIEGITLNHRHLLLIRDPVAVLSSWGNSGGVHGNNPTSDEVGIVPLLSIYSHLESRQSVLPPVILDSDELVRDPKAALSNICQQLGIGFVESMLTWPEGEHNCDGPWAKWWYQNVHKSSGWSTTDTTKPTVYRTLDPSLMHALQASFPAYSFLSQLTAHYQQRGPPSSTLYEDPRNEHLLVYIGAPNRGRLFPRQMAPISPWDSAVQGGDACWEGIRVYRGKILSLDHHLRRLMRSAKALGFPKHKTHTTQEIAHAIFQTLAANGMRDNAHMRLTLTRGEKCTSSMNPHFDVYGTTLIILPEWKPTEGATTYDNTKGISLISASQRRNSPSTCDSKIHHNNLINNILPKIQANLAGAADALMLDLDGFVSETNATNVFMVDDEGTLLTPHVDHCLPGITRNTVLVLAKELGIPNFERRVSLSEFHAAEEVFTTGTMGELTPVTEIDGRIIGCGQRGPVTQRLQEAYKRLPEREGWATKIPPFD